MGVHFYLLLTQLLAQAEPCDTLLSGPVTSSHTADYT